MVRMVPYATLKQFSICRSMPSILYNVVALVFVVFVVILFVVTVVRGLRVCFVVFAFVLRSSRTYCVSIFALFKPKLQCIMCIMMYLHQISHLEVIKTKTELN